MNYYTFTVQLPLSTIIITCFNYQEQIIAHYHDQKPILQQSILGIQIKTIILPSITHYKCHYQAP